MDKKCTKCGEIKPITEFNKNKCRKDGYSCSCKGCCKKRKIYNKPLTGDKKCSKCGIIKSVSEFSPNKNTLSGCHSGCKDCLRAEQPHYRQKYKTLEKRIPCDNKKCPKCKKVKSSTEFPKSLYKRDGLGGYCKKCCSDRENIKRHLRLSRGECVRCGIKNPIKSWLCQSCSNKHNQKKYGSTIKARTRRNALRKIKRATDIKYKLTDVIRSRIYNILRGYNTDNSFIRGLGCSVDELKKYLESKFYSNMDWESWGYGHGNWQIHHIKSLHTFDLTNKEEFLVAANFQNLQPLWFEDHQKIHNLERQVA